MPVSLQQLLPALLPSPTPCRKWKIFIKIFIRYYYKMLITLHEPAQPACLNHISQPFHESDCSHLTHEHAQIQGICRRHGVLEMSEELHVFLSRAVALHMGDLLADAAAVARQRKDANRRLPGMAPDPAANLMQQVAVIRCAFSCTHAPYRSSGRQASSKRLCCACVSIDAHQLEVRHWGSLC